MLPAPRSRRLAERVGNRRSCGMVRRCLRLLTVIAALAVSVAAGAQTAYTVRAANMRAGPGRDYPLVSWLPQGAPVTLAGCYEGWRWCDVIAPPNRGWVYSGFLSYPYQGRRVTILDAGPMLGLSLVPFSLGLY
jgi:uncharacterized protein YraI